jgi:hypothetical protein
MVFFLDILISFADLCLQPCVAFDILTEGGQRLRVDEVEKETKGVQHIVVHHIQNLWHKYHLFVSACCSQANATTSLQREQKCKPFLHTNIRAKYFITCIPEEIGQGNEL